MTVLAYTILFLGLICTIAAIVIYNKLTRLMKDRDIYNPVTKQWANPAYQRLDTIKLVLFILGPILLIGGTFMWNQDKKKLRPMQFMFL